MRLIVFRRVWEWKLWITLALIAVPLQGWLAYLYVELRGDFLGIAGLKCTVGALAFDLVLLVVTLKNFDQVHASAMANPHSLLGQSLRQGPPLLRRNRVRRPCRRPANRDRRQGDGIPAAA